MIKKLNLYLMIFMILMVLFGLLYTIIANAIVYFKKVEPLEFVNIKSELIDNNLVKDHNIYYSLSSALTNLTNTLTNKEYDEIYSLIDSKYIKAYTKNEIIKKVDYIADNELNIKETDSYNAQINIKNAYFYNDFYIVSFTDSMGKESYFAIKLNIESSTYTFTFVE